MNWFSDYYYNITYYIPGMNYSILALKLLFWQHE